MSEPPKAAPPKGPPNALAAAKNGTPPTPTLFGGAAPHVEPVQNLEHTRRMFWQNVVREMLVSLPAMAARHPHLMDGRIALLTRAGERIPITAVEPLFPCSIMAPETMQLCMAVQCTVFNVRAPSGEIFTIPLEEVRAIHTLGDDLMQELEAAAKEAGAENGAGGEPFGFAAFTSLARQQRAGLVNEDDRQTR